MMFETEEKPAWVLMFTLHSLGHGIAYKVVEQGSNSQENSALREYQGSLCDL